MIRKNFLYYALIIFVLCIFLSSRLYKITEIPSSLYWDEASIGYNAYFVLTTGKDEWGEVLPVHFRAFGEFKLPVYIYSVALAIKLFGFSDFAIRIPSVIYALGTLIVANLLIYEITKNKWLGLFSMFFLTLSPWYFLFSRTGYEAVAGLFFFSLAIYVFIISKNVKLFVFSIILLVISFYSYNSFRILSPLAFLIFIIKKFLTKEEIRLKFFAILISVLLFMFSLVPFYRLVSADYGLSRFNAIGEKSSLGIIKNYVLYFSPDFLFKSGDMNLRSHVPGAGQIWITDGIFVLLGLLIILKNKNKNMLILIFGLVVSLLPGAITRESPHSLRAITVVIFLAILWSFGISLFMKKKILKFILLIILFLNLFQFSFYFENFTKNYNNYSEESWQGQYKRIFVEYKDQINKHDKIIITDKFAQPYIFALYYLRIEPNYFVKTKSINPVSKWGESTISSFGKFQFRNATEKDIDEGNLVFSSEEILQTSSTINVDNKNSYIYVYNNK